MMDSELSLSRARRRPRTDERGSGALETALVFPAILLLIFGAVQAGIYEYSRSMALAAAQIGARAAAAQHGTAGDGQTAALNYVNTVNNHMVTNIDAAATRGTDAVVTVTCQSPSLVPGLDTLDISQTATLPVERIT